MCIRDRRSEPQIAPAHDRFTGSKQAHDGDWNLCKTSIGACLLYTSDAADERSSVDLGGRRIIKKKKAQD